MSILICSTTYGGCGYVGDGSTFLQSGIEDFVPCSECGEDYAFQLTDENINRLTNEENKKEAKSLLQINNSTIHGSLLEFCVRDGYIKRENLTPEQKKELEE